MWITTQFLTNTAPGTVVDLDVPHRSLVAQRRRCTSNASVDGELMLSSLCAHTSRPEGKRATFLTMPSVPPPKDCGPLAEPFDAVPNRPRSFFDSLDRRVAAGKFAFGEDQRPQPSRLRCGAAFAGSRCGLPQAWPSLETSCRSASVSPWASHSAAQASTTPSELSRPISRLNGRCSKSSQSLSNIRSGTARSGCGPKQANSSLLPNKRASSERAITPPFPAGTAGRRAGSA